MEPLYNVGDRVQRVGWQLAAQGKVLDAVAVGNRLLYLVEWDFRGMENDITTIWEDEIAPVINWPTLTK